MSNKIIIDASKTSLNIMPRGCGKTNMQLRLMLAWYESYITRLPVEIEFGMVEVKI